MKVTQLPAQKGFADATIDIPAGVFLFRIIIIGEEVTGFGLAQARLEVTLHVI